MYILTIIALCLCLLFTSCIKKPKDKFITPKGNLADIVKLEMLILSQQNKIDSLSKELKKYKVSVIPTKLKTYYYEKTMRKKYAIIGKEELTNEKDRKGKVYYKCKVDNNGLIWERVAYNTDGKIVQDKLGKQIWQYKYNKLGYMTEMLRFKEPSVVANKQIYNYEDGKRVSITHTNGKGEKQTLPLERK